MKFGFGGKGGKKRAFLVKKVFVCVCVCLAWIIEGGRLFIFFLGGCGPSMACGMGIDWCATKREKDEAGFGGVLRR